MGWGFALSLPFFWTAGEHIKSWFLTGFPWENLGYSQFQALHIIQIADITGVYGISFIIVFINCAVFSLLQSTFSRKGIPFAETALCLVLLASTAVYGNIKLNNYNKPAGKMLKVAVIQPDIPQDKKMGPPHFLTKQLKHFPV